jgi:hypothetical protein
MQSLLDVLGHEGHSCWWILVELCAEKLEKDKSEEYTEAHCRFVFNERFLRSNLRIGRAKVRAILNQCQTLALLSFQISENEIQIDMPKLLECLDRDSKRARTERAPTAPKKKRKIKKKEEEKEIGFAAKPLHPLITLWNEFSGDLPKVQKSNKARDQKTEIRWPENTPDEWMVIIKRIASSSFCNGKSDRGWIATYDWLIQAETHLKVSEGKYDNREGTGAALDTIDFGDTFKKAGS